MDNDDLLAALLDDDEEDVELLSPEVTRDLSNTVVYNLDWTVATVLSQLEQGAIDLQPQYQRRDAWTVSRKSKLIESLILGLPVPHIVLAEKREAKGTFLVLDGKQRLTTLAQFAGILPSSPLNTFSLAGLPLRPDLNGTKFRDFSADPALASTRNAFLNQPLKTAILRGWETTSLLHIVFHRLNSQVVPLSPQELRQALIPGPFMGFLNEYSGASPTLQWLLDLDGPDFRMRDSELLLRLLGLTQYRDAYKGNLRRFLDTLATRLSENWNALEISTKGSFAEIEDAIEAWGRVLTRPLVGRKYVNGKYEARFNRAVLDAQVFAALRPSIRELMERDPLKAKNAFQNVMSDDETFRRSIEATTKSIDAVSYRMDTLAAAMEHKAQ
ncbi:MAG: DUF262 domain-containing protein [Gemmatimonadales bacterium]|nr:DUF262 domain-containing protein [Gemmatimonadales bacterium]